MKSAGAEKALTPAIVRLFKQKDNPEHLAQASAGVARQVSEIIDASFRNVGVREAGISVVEVLPCALKGLDDLIKAHVSIWHQSSKAGPAVLVMLEKHFVLGLLDAIFGGKGQQGSISPDRRLTELEKSIAVEASSICVAGLLAQLGADQAEAEDCAKSGKLVDAPPDGAGPHATHVMIKLASNTLKGSFALVFPNVMLAQSEADDNGEDADVDARTEEWREGLRANVAEVSVTLRAIMNGVDVEVAEVLSLQPGSILRVEDGAIRHVAIGIDGAEIFSGHLGQSDGHYTVLIGGASEHDGAPAVANG